MALQCVIIFFDYIKMENMIEHMTKYLVKLGYSKTMLKSLTTSQLSNLYHAKLNVWKSRAAHGRF